MTRFAISLAALLAAAPALAGGPPVTLYDTNNQALGTQSNPLIMSPSSGGAMSTVNQGSAGSSAWPVSIPDVRGTGTIASGTAGANYAVATNNQGTARFSVTGLTASGATLQAQYSADGGTTWEPIAILRPPLAYGTTITADGQYEVKASATTNLRLAVTATGTGTINVASDLTNAQGLVGVVGPLPPGTNTVGKVGIDQTTPGTTNGVQVNASALPANAAQETGGNLATLVARTPALGANTRANSQPVTIATDQPAVPVADPNNASYQNSVALTVGGSAVAAGRGFDAVCTAPGLVTVTMAGGASKQVPVQGTAAPGAYTSYGFAITAITASTATCSAYANLY